MQTEALALVDGILLKLESVEVVAHSNSHRVTECVNNHSVIDLSSSDYDSDDSSSRSSEDEIARINGKRCRVSDGDEGVETRKKKGKRVKEEFGAVLPPGFLDPLPPKATANGNGGAKGTVNAQGCKQFWKAGDFEGDNCGFLYFPPGGIDRARVHPRFLHSNATSHKWVLGAFAELLDNSLDEVCNGATFVNIDMLKNKKDGSRMLLIEDNGGGMDPEKMRQCMSLGYSLKSKISDTIGQYGNGFKTSTMRLGADVIVFSRSPGRDRKRSTQSIGLLSYTFLRSAGKEDIIVPMLDYEKSGSKWKKMIRSSVGDWNNNVESIVQWSPFSSEADLLRQFDRMKDQGTRIIIYNLWEDDQGLLELDFDSDQNDIQIRGVNRDENSIQMAQKFPTSRHFLTYRHSLRSYASILYLRIPPGFRIILRGKDVEHHNIVNDMMMIKEVTYRPQPGADRVPKDPNMVAVVTMGFVKDAKLHIDIQGFNVYHKNRLIKPFWRLWNAAGSDGRGVIGILEANFVEPAHDKQGFERTTVLSRLEARLILMQKDYWYSFCHKIGYAPRRNKKNAIERENSPDCLLTPSKSKKKIACSEKFSMPKSQKLGEKESGLNSRTAFYGNGNLNMNGKKGRKSSPSLENLCDDDFIPERRVTVSSRKAIAVEKSLPNDGSQTTQLHTCTRDSEDGCDFSTGGKAVHIVTGSQSKEQVGGNDGASSCSTLTLEQLIEENRELRERLRRTEEESLGDLRHDLECEKDRCKSLEAQLQEAQLKIEELNKEQENLINIFSEERERRDSEEENLRRKLKEASRTIQELLEKVRMLERMKSSVIKS